MNKRSKVILAMFLTMLLSVPMIVFAVTQDGQDYHNYDEPIYCSSYYCADYLDKIADCCSYALNDDLIFTKYVHLYLDVTLEQLEYSGVDIDVLMYFIVNFENIVEHRPSTDEEIQSVLDAVATYHPELLRMAASSDVERSPSIEIAYHCTDSDYILCNFDDSTASNIISCCTFPSMGDLYQWTTHVVHIAILECGTRLPMQCVQVYSVYAPGCRNCRTIFGRPFDGPPRPGCGVPFDC